MSSTKMIFTVLAAVLLCSAAMKNPSSSLGAAQKFYDLLGTTMLEMGSHKYNQTILANAKRTSTVPLFNTLFLSGSGVRGAAAIRKAKPLIKDPLLHIFTYNGQLKKGNILFSETKSTYNGAIVVKESSIVKESGRCTKCGVEAELAVKEDAGAVPLPGPQEKGLYKLIIDLEKGTVSYHCSDMCWPHTNFGTGLYVVGKAVCGGEWEKAYKEKRGPELIKDAGSDTYRAKVHLCPDGYEASEFKLARKQGSRAKSLGIQKGAWEPEQTPNLAKGGHGWLTQYGGKGIPGPTVEADYEIVVDMTLGEISEHCIGTLCNGPDGGPSLYVPEKPIHEKKAAFVHLFSWRWPDIALECEQFLGPKGFTGVQIAPPQESKVPRKGKRDSWNYVYRPVSYKLNSKLGTEAEFTEMIQRCNSAGVEIYADAVINHMGGGAGTGSGGTKFWNRDFPDTGFGSYLPSDFHHTGDDTSTNCEMRQGEWDGCDETCRKMCDLNGMPDLDTASPKVQGMLAAYLNHLMDLGVAGFRVDASDHTGSTDLEGIFENVQPKFRFFETIKNDDDMQAKMSMGRVTQFGYRRKLMKGLMDADIDSLINIGTPMKLVPSSEAVVFVINHDNLMHEDYNGHGVTYKKPAIYTLGNVVMLALPYGYPKVLSSYYFPYGDLTYPPPTTNVHGEQGELHCGDNENWVCEHRWPAIANMVTWRKYAGDNMIDLWEVTGNTQAYFCRGLDACILINAGSEEWTVAPKLALAPGDYCNIIVSDDVAACPKIRVDAGGIAKQLNEDGSTSDIKVPGIGAIAMHAGATR